MTTDQNAGMIFALAALVLPVSALMSRRVRLGDAAKMALAWVAIFGVGVMLYGLRDQARSVLTRVQSVFGGDQPAARGGVVRVPMAADGHFWVRASVNGVERDFLIDSGATMTALSSATADAAGIERGQRIAIDTANGTIIAHRARIARLELGSIARGDLGAVTADAFGETDVLGMNFLTSLSSWGVEGNMLVLRP